MRTAVLMVVGIALASVPAHGQAGGAEQHVAALKKSLASSQARLRQYEWIETTIINLKGEEKARKQNRCYYGADGKVQKVPIGDKPEQASSGGGRRGRLKQHIVEKKKDEMQDYMERAANLIHLYVPPNPEQIQAAKEAGKLALRPGQGRVRLEFTDYLKTGDLMAIEIDPATDSLLGLSRLDVSRQGGRSGQARGPRRGASGRHDLYRADDPRRACQEHPRRHRELRLSPGEPMRRIQLFSPLLALLAACDRGADAPAAPPPDAGASPVAIAAGSRPPPIIETTDAQHAPTRILDPRADEILRAMSALLASTPRFAFEAEKSFDEIPSGQPRILLTNLRRVAVQRPNRFAADADGDSLSRSVWFDGRAVSALDKTTLTYATIPASGSIDAALDTLSDKYGVSVPLADLLYADPYAVLTEEVTYSKYLGIHRAGGRPLPPSRVRTAHDRVANLDRRRRDASAPQARHHLRAGAGRAAIRRLRWAGGTFRLSSPRCCSRLSLRTAPSASTPPRSFRGRPAGRVEVIYGTHPRTRGGLRPGGRRRLTCTRSEPAR